MRTFPTITLLQLRRKKFKTVDLTFHTRTSPFGEHLLNLTILPLCLASCLSKLHSLLFLSLSLAQMRELHAAKTCLITSITILCSVGFNLRASACTLMKLTKTDYLITSFAVERKADFDFPVAGSNSLSRVHCHFPLPSLRVSDLLKMKGFQREAERVISAHTFTASVVEQALTRIMMIMRKIIMSTDLDGDAPPFYQATEIRIRNPQT